MNDLEIEFLEEYKALDILLKDFSSYANQVTSQIVSHTEEMAASLGRPLIYLTSSKLPKEQTALDVLKNDPVSEGLICILSVVENCQTFQPVKQDNGLLQLRSVTRKCKYYYFYYSFSHSKNLTKRDKKSKTVKSKKQNGR